jgi:histidinol-phosphate aminotransferase
VVIDEAYGEFTDAEGIPSSVDLVRKGARNLLVLRTFSKAFGAAGIRLGYGIADEGIIDVLLKMKPPYNVNAMSQACGLKLWNERERMEKNVQTLLFERDRLMNECRNLNCKVFPTITNFFLVQLPEAVDSDAVYARLRDQYRIVLRKIKGLPQKNVLRISVGSKEENDLLLSSLSTLL